MFLKTNKYCIIHLMSKRRATTTGQRELFPSPDPTLQKVAQKLIDDLPNLDERTLVNRLVGIGLFESVDEIRKEWNGGIAHFGSDRFQISFKEYIDSNRQFYSEMLARIASGEAATFSEAWEMQREEMQKFTQEVRRRIGETRDRTHADTRHMLGNN